MRSYAISLFTQPMHRIRKIGPEPHLQPCEKLVSHTGSARCGAQSGSVVREQAYTLVITTPNPMGEDAAQHPDYRTLTGIQGDKRAGTVAVGALDTVVLPVRSDDACRRLLFEQRRWHPVLLSGEKLQNLRYAAFCFGSPIGAITHYAVVRSYTPAPDDPHKTILHFFPPEALGQALEWRQGRGLHRPRYTAFAMLLEAKHIDELFGP